jgi:hypothetical protein
MNDMAKPPRSTTQQKPPRLSAEDRALQENIDLTLARLEVGMAQEKKAMDELLAKLRTTRIAA